MVKTSCTKCGATVMRLNKKTSISQKTFPIFKITKYEDYDGAPTQIELCKRCSKDFESWLERGQDDFDDIKLD